MPAPSLRLRLLRSRLATGVARSLRLGSAGSGGYWINTGASWGGAPRITGLNIQAKTDNAGFSITPSADNGKFGLTDQNKAWVKPIDGLTFETGIDIETDTWRGADGFGSWNFLRFGAENGDNVTFSRMGNNGSGFQSDIVYNKDGIGAWADWYQLRLRPTRMPLPSRLPTGIDATSATRCRSAPLTPLPVSARSRFSTSAYKSNGENGGVTSISGIYTIRTVLTKGNGKAFGAYQVAFNLSAVKGLYEEVGVQLPNDAKEAGYAYQVTDSATYTMDKTTFHALRSSRSAYGRHKPL